MSTSAPKTAASETTPARKPGQPGGVPAETTETTRSAKSAKSADEGKTRIEQDGEAAPRLPHEHDQSSDSQRSKEATPPRVGKQALKDVERGIVDTDRGPEADRVYNDKVKR
jgi:hypothetical protein